jgi:hypothetical protein
MNKIGVIAKVLWVCALAVAGVGCGKAPTYDVPEEFAPYVERFQQEAAANGVHLSITDLRVQFGQMRSASETGACEINGDETPTITVNQAAWDRRSDAEREELMYHELGHCALKRQHNLARAHDGRPASIMNPYSLGRHTYEQHRDEYVAELFSHAGDF